jgi:hypothetical protein
VDCEASGSMILYSYSRVTFFDNTSCFSMLGCLRTQVSYLFDLMQLGAYVMYEGRRH